ncbi:hypothetical protein Acr_22g0007240 [Actinidia rufa]|uniref:Uncharacterized protein n=1 Tax=Actinidia rufa TaxID=165716 RepID=A0A7J0GKJ2_9ERIC|nr:hypothetical protein Acr_22g0007240 [Actinidia rufa]
MDTSSLTKESNVMSQVDLDNLGRRIHSPRGTTPDSWDGETILSARKARWRFMKPLFGWFKVSHSPNYQGHFDSLPDLPCAAVPQRVAIGHMFAELAPRIPEQRKGVEDEVLFCLGDEWELARARLPARVLLRVPRSWGTPGKAATSCRLCPEVDAKRMEAVFGKIEPGGYFEVSKVLNSRTFKRHFAGGCSAFSTSGRDNTTSGDEGEFGTGEDSVEYLGVIRRGVGGAIRRALPDIPDETLLRWLGGKVKDPFTNLLSGTSGSSSDSGSDSISDSELPPELRSDAMSARGKAVAEKAKKAAAAKHPTKGVVIREKRSNPTEGRSMPGGVLLRRGLFPAGDRESQSMSDASVARRLLTGVIPASDKKKSTNYPRMTWSPNLSTPWVVVYASSLALRSQEHLHDIDFHMARADSTELELVKAQKRAVKAETRVAELNEEISRPGTEELAIEDFKASEEFKAAVTDSAATYFGDGFEFCKRQLLHQFPNLGADVANMAMDPIFAEEEEATKEGGDHATSILAIIDIGDPK